MFQFPVRPLQPIWIQLTMIVTNHWLPIRVSPVARHITYRRYRSISTPLHRLLTAVAFTVYA